jgi:periplasmic protein TonB
MSAVKPSYFKSNTGYVIRIQSSIAAVLLILIVLFRCNLTFDHTSELNFEVSEPVAFLEIERTIYAERPTPPPRPTAGTDVPADILPEEEIILLRDRDYYFNLPFRLVESDLSHLARPLLGEVERDPELLTDTRFITRGIRYPEQARRAGVEGHVVVEFTVNKNGHVVNPRIIEGLGFGCDESAIQAVQKFRFRPALKEGQRVSVDLRETVYFKLI